MHHTVYKPNYDNRHIHEQCKNDKRVDDQICSCGFNKIISDFLSCQTSNECILENNGNTVNRLCFKKTSDVYFSEKVALSKNSFEGNVSEFHNSKKTNSNDLKSKSKSLNRYLKLGNLNIRSLTNKIEQLQVFVNKYDFDIFSVNETWLDESIADNDIKILGYSIIRKDRNRHGGGVCFYVKECLNYHVHYDIGNAIESVWISVKQSNENVIIGTIYRPPSSNSKYYDDMLNEIQRARDISNHVIIMGDLNYNYVLDDTLERNAVFNIETLFEMNQLIKEPTRVTERNSSLLDVILTTNAEQHTNTKVIRTTISDHDCVYTEYKNIKPSKTNNCHRQICFKDFKKFNADLFVNDLKNNTIINDVDFSDDELRLKWVAFKKSFLDICNTHVPLKTIRVKDRYNPWINDAIVKLMYERDHSKRLAIKTNDACTWNKYKQLRNEVSTMIRDSKKSYYEKKLSECGKNPKKLWNCINKITGNKVFEQPHKDLDCNTFNDHFSSIGEKVVSKAPSEPTNIPWKNPRCLTKFSFEQIDPEFVKKFLKNLGDETNTDVIGFDCKLLSIGANELAPILTKFFNASINTAYVPEDWKLAKVIPVFKGKGKLSDLNNYRPISLISHVAKVFEIAVHSQLLQYFQDNDLICIDQSAYRKFHNTQTALHRIIDEWIDNVAFNTYTGICSFDIKKCFDTIDHSILLRKLQLYGVSSKEIDWFKSYLTKRQQVVKCHEKVSENKFVNIGVPQGSVLGPLLFTVFINDISQHVYLGSTNLFADDTLVYCTGLNGEDTKTKLQHCVNDVSMWYKSNNIVVNEEKCCSMIICPKGNNFDNFEISVNDCNVDQVKSMNYLGLEIDDRLSWDNYTNKLCKHVNIKISRFARLRKTVPKNIMIKIYNSAIQPCIDYVISVWGNSKKVNLNKIQRAQNYCARVVEKNFDYINFRGLDLVKKLGWMTVLQRFLYFRLLLVFKCIHGLAPPYMCNNIIMDIEIKGNRTRKHDMDLYLQFPESEFHKNMFFYGAARSWNNLPSHLKECTSLHNFKKLLKLYVKTQPEI